jgi:DNA polymerase-3 subunit beta
MLPPPPAGPTFPQPTVWIVNSFNQTVKTGGKNIVALGRQPLLAALQRAAILTSEKFKGVRMDFEPGVLKIAANNTEQEEASDELEVDYTGEPIEMVYDRARAKVAA